MRDGEAPVHGILLEGLNYSGKSGLATALVEQLRGHGETVASRHCYIVADPLNDRLQHLAFDSLGDWAARPFPDPDLMRTFNVLKSAQMMIDSELVARRQAHYSAPERTLVQDRHWFSQYCNNEFFNADEGLLSTRWVEELAPRFLLQIYLTCSEASRRARAEKRASQPEAHDLNRYLRAHLDAIGAFERLNLSFVEHDPNWTVVHTDDMAIEDVVAVVADEWSRKHLMAGR